MNRSDRNMNNSPARPGAESPEAARRRRIEAAIRDYQQPLLRYVARLLHNATLAQDVVQNVFVKLCRQWQPRGEVEESLKPWLYRVAHNEAVDLVRREERRRDLHQRSAETVANLQHERAEAAATAEKHQQVLAALHCLKPAERQVILLRLQEGLSYQEIATVIGRPTGSVGALLHTAVKKLSLQVQRRDEP